MSELEDISVSLEGFSGTVRLFPLPNLVLFPHVLQPLHIHERRYRQSLSEALADDHLMAMATLAPGWENDYEGRPPLYPFACLARIAVAHRLENGTSNVMLLGLQRIRIARELPPKKSFREAKVSICDDLYPAGKAVERAALGRKLRNALVATVPGLHLIQEQLDQLLESDLPLGVLTDIISYTMNTSLEEKQALLAELNVHRRVGILLEHLEAMAVEPAQCIAESVVFPPSFSDN